MKRHFRIQITILISSLLVLILTSGSIIFYNYINTRNENLHNADEQIRSATDTISEATAAYLNPASVSTKFLAWFAGRYSSILDNKALLGDQAMKMLELYPQIAGFYCGDNQGNLVAVKPVTSGENYPYSTNTPLPSGATFEIQTINRSPSSTMEFYTYMDQDGRTVGTQQRPFGSGGPYFDPRSRPWYHGAAETGHQYWSDPYIFILSHQIGITAAAPVKTSEGKVHMVISADITMAEISQTLKKHKIGKSGITFILDENGNLIGYPDQELVIKNAGGKTVLATYKDTKNPVIIESFERFQKTGELSFRITQNGDPYLVSFKKLGQQIHKKWLLGFIVYLPELTAEANKVTNYMMIFSVLVVIAATIIIFIISKNIARPIERISEDLNKISHFDIDTVKVEESNFTEISRMNNAMENMKRSLRDFSRFVPKSVVKKLIESGSGAEIGGTKKNITLMFTDIKGFTSLSEQMTSERLIKHLSNYLNELTIIIQKNKGTIDKYIGDAIMSFWGAPDIDDQHSLHACRAAYECQLKLRELNHSWELDGKPPFFTRIGLHTGDAIVGNVGSEDRLNYSAFGDSVNMASRLEGVNKAYGTQILISHSTFTNVRQHFICRPVDLVTVVGKTEPMRIYELSCPISEDDKDKYNQEEMARLSELCEQAFEHYLNKEWDQALEGYKLVLKNHPSDSVAKVFIDRIENYKKSPPPSGWNGVYAFTKK